MAAQPSDNHPYPVSIATEYAPESRVVLRYSATIDDLIALPDTGSRYELIRGVLIQMPPPKRLHGVICMRLGARLSDYCRTHGMENQLADNVGYDLTGTDEKHTVLAPDLSIAQEVDQMSRDAPYEKASPLLAIEVVSPSDTRQMMADKAITYLYAGVHIVWIIWPDTKTVEVWTSQKTTILTEQEVLEGSDILPGFSITVREIFPG